ncbi:hypothetical protein THICB2_220060 [Thiomonas sp. CB2]|nr:hypothetical protein THICB2_220060 [Thiomonas sp. CB2]CQR44782.1 hypothetical protein THICB3560147 [Thiomonas sp. CB3]VDY05750.1 protein of unknown function [Thiomonas sp. Bio17B3]VDY10951.1 protein of unknown function [Thiomonas sp. Sup16B3]VDY14009.1 conserved protein of unknown function [Thiomonas sp. OC7]
MGPIRPTGRPVLGLSGHWPPLVATTAMVGLAVAEVVSMLSALFQRWPDAGLDSEATSPGTDRVAAKPSLGRSCVIVD